MLKAVLDTSVFLQWCSAYDDVRDNHAHTNLQFGLDIMLPGHRKYADLVSHIMIGTHAYLQQVSDLAFKTLKLCMPQENVGYFHSLSHQVAETFSDFFDPCHKHC